MKYGRIASPKSVPIHLNLSIHAVQSEHFSLFHSSESIVSVGMAKALTTSYKYIQVGPCLCISQML